MHWVVFVLIASLLATSGGGFAAPEAVATGEVAAASPDLPGEPAGVRLGEFSLSSDAALNSGEGSRVGTSADLHCPRCGYVHKADDNFCASCGLFLKASGAPAGSEAPSVVSVSPGVQSLVIVPYRIDTTTMETEIRKFRHQYLAMWAILTAGLLYVLEHR